MSSMGIDLLTRVCVFVFHCPGRALTSINSACITRAHAHNNTYWRFLLQNYQRRAKARRAASFRRVEGCLSYCTPAAAAAGDARSHTLPPILQPFPPILPAPHCYSC
jgi:hypothetical protein